MPRMIRLLCVEDDTLLATYLVTRLGLEPDIEVVGVVPSATEALGLLQREEVDVVLLDYRLEGPDGLQLLGALSNTRAESNGPRVLFCTGTVEQEFEETARKLGAAGVVPKDRMSYQLIPAVRKVAAGGCWFENHC